MHYRDVARKVAGYAALSLALALMAGCGGGSSDSAAPPVSPLRVSPFAVTATVVQGNSATLTATLFVDTKAAGTTVYIGMQDANRVAASIDITATTADSGTVTIYTVTTLAVGTHTGKFSFYACKDANCTSKYSAIPADLNYTVTITPPPPAATLNPASLTATVESGDPLTTPLVAQLAPGLYASGFLALDPNSTFSPTVAVTPMGGQNYSLTLSVPASVAAGVYTGTLSLEVCSSSDCAAGTQLPGSPVSLPYTVTVTPAVILVSPPTASGLPEWETYQGNADHSGYVPVTLDATKFAPKWSWTLPAAYSGAISPVTTGSGKVVASVAGYFQNAYLFALNEADGSISWRHDFGSIFTVNHPTVAGGRVFVASSGHADTFMWSFDIADGTQEFQTAFDSQWEHYLAPTFKDGFIYTNGGTYGGMYRFKGSSGVRTWFAGLNQYDLWTPAVDGQYAYAYTGYEFAVVDRTSGARVQSYADPTFNWYGYSLNMAPVLPGDGSVVLVNGVFNFAHANQLIRYNVAPGTESWRIDGTYVSDPAIAAGKVYVLNGASNQLEVRDLNTGAVLWTWQAGPGESLPFGNLVLTQNMVFLSTSAATYAIDLTTHQIVWSTPVSGHLALSSNCVLYIVPGDSTIRAYSLK